MSATVVHLGGAGPALHAAASWLFERGLRGGRADLGGVAVVVPGARAGRRLLEILVARTDDAKLALVPPRIVTTAALDELLLPPARTIAGPLARQMTWARVLREADPVLLARIARDRPGDDDWLGWLALAEVLDRLHGELAGHGLDCDEVARRGARLANFADGERWEALASIQRAYLQVLAEAGRDEPSVRRLVALANDAVRHDWEIVLLGVVELQPALRDLLAATRAKVSVLVAAPEAHSERFDAWGCLRPEAWSTASIEVAETSIRAVDRPVDQAAAVLDAVAALGACAPSDVAIGVPDERVVPFIESQFQAAGVRTRFAAGVPLTHTPPCRVLAGVADFLDHPHFAELAALVRQPDVEQWIRTHSPDLARGDWLTALDHYAAEHVPSGLDDEPHGSDEAARIVGSLAETVRRLLTSLGTGRRSLADHADTILAFLIGLYGERPLRASDPDDRVRIEACAAIRDVATALRDAGEAVVPRVDATEAIRIVLRALAHGTVAPDPETPAIELLGWLELVLDDVPHLVVTGMNDGIVPEALNADAFLPNALRRHLGLLDNEGRYARDAYALTTLLARCQSIALVVGRTDAAGDPLAPSRLLFACEPARVPPRVKRFFRGLDPPPAARRAHPPLASTAIAVPRPQPLKRPIGAMGVTWFRDYLACPYRFYLKRVLRLQVERDDAVELSPPQWGTLAHDALRAFGLDPIRGSSDAHAIEKTLQARLDEIATERFGARPPVAVRVQLEQLRERLSAFASWQARWASEGWEIVAVEVPLDDGQFIVGSDGGRMPLRGRIDRVDRNQRTGECVVFDYKTSDRARTPEQVHRARGRWSDLQLPLYRTLVPDHPTLAPHLAGSVPRVGFVNLPNDADDAGEQLAGWSDEDFADAQQVARTVVDGVRAERFWPPASPPPAFSEAFAAICQQAQFVADDALAEDE